MPFLPYYPKFIPQKQQARLTTHKSRQDRSGHKQKISNNFFLLLLAIALSPVFQAAVAAFLVKVYSIYFAPKGFM